MTEIEAAIDFAQQFSTDYDDNYVIFHTTLLKDAINDICLGPIKLRKIITLYLHNNEDPFSKMFCSLLSVDGEVSKILENRYYYFLGWTVNCERYHKSIIQALDECVDFEPAKRMVKEKKAALIIIYPIQDSITIFSILHGAKVNPKDVLFTLQEVEKNFRAEIQNEEDLENIKGNENCIGSKELQQLMFDRLSNRHYDHFAYDEHEYLKNKIGFSKYGPPNTTDGYDKIQLKTIEDTYKQIREFNNKYAEWKDEVVISFIYNCLEPRAEEKLARAKKYADYNPNDDLLPIALYVIRKCQGSANPCRIFVDNANRIYNSWKDYLTGNKLHKCTMVLPKNGQYGANDEDEVFLEKHLSPSCGIGHAVLKGTDIASTIVGLTSGGIIIASLIPTLVIAPVALTVAAATGIGVGAYSVIRNAANIYDRSAHAESLSFANSEARGAYLNIVAGTLGFVGAGATTAVAELAAKGVDIGQGAQVAFNTVRLMNMSATGINAFNSTYTIVDDWFKEQQKASPLIVMQFKSSLLFFENIISSHSNLTADEEETKLLQSVSQSYVNSKKNKVDILKLHKIVNKRQTFEMLNRNSSLLSQQDIYFTLENDVIKFNGLSVEIDTFLARKRVIDLSPFLKPVVTSSNCTSENTKALFKSINKKYEGLFANDSFVAISVLLENFTETAREKFLKVLDKLINNLVNLLGSCFFRILKNHFYDVSSDSCTVVFQFIIDFINVKMDEDKIQNKIKETPHSSNNENYDALGDNAEYFSCLEKFINFFVVGNFVDVYLLNDLIQHVLRYIVETLYIYCESLEKQKKQEENASRNPYKIVCKECGGHYFYKKQL